VEDPLNVATIKGLSLPLAIEGKQFSSFKCDRIFSTLNEMQCANSVEKDSNALFNACFSSFPFDQCSC